MNLKKLIFPSAVQLGLLAVVAGIVFSLLGCNTVRGLGQDLEKLGETIQKSSK